MHVRSAQQVVSLYQRADRLGANLVRARPHPPPTVCDKGRSRTCSPANPGYQDWRGAVSQRPEGGVGTPSYCVRVH